MAKLSPAQKKQVQQFVAEFQPAPAPALAQ
jgi:hypothetical protein